MLIFSLIACFLSLFVVTNVSAATTRVVPTVYTTIQDAVDAAASGDTIFIKNGTYLTPNKLLIGGSLVKITKNNLTLVGESRDGVIIRGRNDKSGSTEDAFIKGIHVMADNVTIKNLTVEKFKGGIGVEERGFGIVFDDFDSGIYVNGKVENVKLQINGTALRAHINDNMTVTGSLILGNAKQGIKIFDCDSATITGNEVKNGFDGIFVIESDYVTISTNDVSASSVVAMGLSQSSSLRVTENRIHDNYGLGIRIYGGTTDIQLSCNTITSNTGGGIKVEDTVSGSRFDLNNIYGNTGLGVNNTTGSTLNFENSWWGCAAGPGKPGCDSVSAVNVDYTPWLLAKKDMYWKDYNGKDIGGYMPDIDQKQDFDNTDHDNNPLTGIELHYCAPTAAADSLWWLAKKHNLNLNLTDINGDGNSDILDLVQELAFLMNTNVGHNGTLPADQKNGIDLFLTNHHLNDVLYVHKLGKPTFTWIEDEVKACQNVKLDLGFWRVKQVISLVTIKWERCGGHAVDVAGVDSNNSLIAISDPDADNAEAGLPGIVRGPNHGNPTGHNDAVSASHDIFKVGPSPSPGGLFGLTDPYWRDTGLCSRYALNNGDYQELDVTYNTPHGLVLGQVFTEIETAVVVSPKIFVIKPNGGESIPANSNYTIQWSTVPDAVKFDLELSCDNGSSWTDIVNGIMDTSYPWNPVSPPQSEKKKNCLVRVIAYDASGNAIGRDTSDAQFTVETVKVTSPDWGSIDGSEMQEILYSGTKWTITWKVYGTSRPVAKVKLFLTKDGGSTWEKIATVNGDDEWYNWTVPSVVTKKLLCKIKVELRDSSNVLLGKDTSDMFFTIKKAP